MTNKEIVIKFINEHNNNFKDLELTDFLHNENIDYMFFADIKELFDYFTEQDYNTLFFDNVIFLKNESIIILI